MTEKPPSKDETDIEILDQINNLDEQDKNELIETLEMYSGPIPHPQILKQYKELYPDAAQKIIDNGVAESRHRRKMESGRQNVRLILAFIALTGFLVICAGWLWFSYKLIITNHALVGSIFGAGGFIVILGSLITIIPDLTKNDDISVGDK